MDFETKRTLIEKLTRKGFVCEYYGVNIICRLNKHRVSIAKEKFANGNVVFDGTSYEVNEKTLDDVVGIIRKKVK